MRLLIAGMLGVLLGVLIGRFGPAKEISELTAELAEKAEEVDCEAQTLGRDLAVLMGSGMQAPAPPWVGPTLKRDWPWPS